MSNLPSRLGFCFLLSYATHPETEEQRHAKDTSLTNDVIRRGATLLGIAGRVKETYPNLTVQGFAAMRAISDSNKFKRLLDPCKGVVRLSGDQTLRRP